jgi:ATP-binding cassette, subfamily B, bacterial
MKNKPEARVLAWLYQQVKPFRFYLALMILVGVLLSLASVAMAVVSKTLIDAVVSGARLQAFAFAYGFAGLILVQVLLQYLNTYLTSFCQSGMENRMQLEAYTALMGSRWQAFNQFHSGDLMTRATSDVHVVSEGLSRVLPGVIALGFRFLAAFLVLFVYDPMLALLAFILSPLAILFTRFFSPRLKRMHVTIQEAESSCRESMHEAIQHLLVLKSFGQEESSEKRLGALQKHRRYWTLKRVHLSALGNTIMAMGFWLGYMMAFGWGAYRLYLGTGTFGTMTAFLQLVGQVQSPFVQMAHFYPQMLAMMASAGRLIAVESLDVDIEPELTAQGLGLSGPLGITLGAVSFGYEDRVKVLTDLDWQIAPGEMVALSGESGQGKTTLSLLLLSLLYPDKGTMELMDTKGGRVAISPASRSCFAYVPQGNTLFSGTIAENLLMGNPEADDTAMKEACEIACVWDFVSSLPLGLETRVGEKGLGLSEGQAQRLAIARALMRKAPILILDEATSALDIAMEELLLTSIRKLCPPCTCLVITHRTTALSLCDRAWKISYGILTVV